MSVTIGAADQEDLGRVDGVEEVEWVVFWVQRTRKMHTRTIAKCSLLSFLLEGLDLETFALAHSEVFYYGREAPGYPQSRLPEASFEPQLPSLRSLEYPYRFRLNSKSKS